MITKRSFGLLFCIFLPGRDHPFPFSPSRSRTPLPDDNPLAIFRTICSVYIRPTHLPNQYY